MTFETYDFDGSKLYCLKTTKFKTVLLSLRFIGAFSEATINERALLPEVLSGATRKLPSRQKLQQHLDYLYGMELGTSTQKLGLQSIVSFDLGFLNEVFLPSPTDMLGEAFALLGDVVFAPKLINGKFMKRLFEQEKRYLIEELEAEYHDKASYCYQRIKKLMFPDELFRFSPRGELTTLSALTGEMLLAAYRSLLDCDRRQLFAVGDFDTERVRQLAQRLLAPRKNQADICWADRETKPLSGVNTVCESGDVNQSRLIVGYRTGIHPHDDLYYPLLVLNTILGDSDQAKLFQTIREHGQLSYDIATTHIPDKGVIFVFAGVENGSETAVVEAIDRVIAECDAATITDEEIRMAKEMLRKRVLESDDAIGANLLRLFYDLCYHRRPVPLVETIAKIDQVTLADIVKAKDALVKDTVYIYRNPGAGR